jgi:hypothetical protein
LKGSVYLARANTVRKIDARNSTVKNKKAAVAAFLQTRHARLFHAVFLAEFLNATGGVDNLLLAGVERMTLRADFDVQVFGHGRVGLERVAAATGHGDFVVRWVNIGFHDFFLK